MKIDGKHLIKRICSSYQRYKKSALIDLFTPVEEKTGIAINL